MTAHNQIPMPPAAEKAVHALGRHDLIKIHAMPGSVGAIAWFTTAEMPRHFGQVPMIETPNGMYGLIVSADGNIPDLKGASIIIQAANVAMGDMPNTKGICPRG